MFECGDSLHYTIKKKLLCIVLYVAFSPGCFWKYYLANSCRHVGAALVNCFKSRQWSYSEILKHQSGWASFPKRSRTKSGYENCVVSDTSFVIKDNRFLDKIRIYYYRWRNCLRVSFYKCSNGTYSQQITVCRQQTNMQIVLRSVKTAFLYP